MHLLCIHCRAGLQTKQIKWCFLARPLLRAAAVVACGEPDRRAFARGCGGRTARAPGGGLLLLLPAWLTR
jgi:hypothetical protein